MDLSNDLISKFVKITNDDKNKNGESTVYGTVVEYNGGMYVRIDGSDLLTPVETTADFKPNERVTVMIKNHSATVTGNITSPATNEGAVTEKVTEAVEEVEGKVITEVEILIADRVSTKQLDAEVARIDELIAGKASVEDLTATNAEITNLKADKASIKDLTATNAEITNLKAKDAEIENLVAGKATVEDLTATNAEITNLKAKDAEIENLVADKARIEDLTATNARIDSLQANKADITYLDANFATIDELEAAHADIEILDAEVANINTLVNGNLTSDNILSLNITSQNTTMENAFVKDAMIDTVTANKIMSGTIDTNNVTIQSTDGSMLLQGTLLQMKDDNGKVRIQIGKDTGGNFTFILYDESGTGVLIDEEGIKSSDAIADGLIVDAKVADNANIAGSKLDIASVITEVNNDNSTTIKSNKIYLDEQGQSLEVAFNSLKTQVETIQDVTIDGDLTAVIEQVQSNTTQIAANKEGISTLVSENTSRKEEIQNLDGEIESVNNTLSSKYSSLEQDVSGFKTIVADTYTTKSEFNNLQIGGTNLLPKSGNFKDNCGLWVSNGSTMTLETVITYNGYNSIKIDNNSSEGIIYNDYITLKPNTTYTYSITAVAAGIVTGDNNRPLHMWVHLPGGHEGNAHHEEILDSSHAGIDTKWGRSYIVFKTPDTDNFYVMKPFIYLTEGQIIYIANFKVEEGNRPTDWSPAPEDIQGQIDATNNNLTNNYSTTSQMNSAIQQKANEITSTVSETYTTKSEFNNLQIGGTNTFKISKVGSETWDINYNSIVTGNSENGFNVSTADGRMHMRLFHTIKDNGYWTVSFKVKSSVYAGPINIDICDLGVSSFNSDTNWSEVTRTVLVDNYSLDQYNFVDIEQHIDCGQAITYYFKDVKVEKGNRATAWSPAPEDVQGQIDATNNNLSANYSTTSAMNSAIQQKANEITSSVSETYTTKSEFNGLQIGGVNLVLWSECIELDSSDHGNNDNSIIENNTVKITPTTDGNVYNHAVYTSETRLQGETYTLSFDILSPDDIGFYWYPSESYSIDDKIKASSKWQTVSFTYTQSGETTANPVLFGFHRLIAGHVYYYRRLKLEKGNKPTAWSPAPSDFQVQITDTYNNLQNNYSTTTAMNSAITQKANEITQTVSETYATKQSVTDVSNNLSANYSTTSAMNSAIQQKANEITSTVSQTYTTKSEFNNLQIGGKNLLLDSKRETTNNGYCIDEFRPTELFEVGEKYTVSICVTPANGVDYILPFISGGYNTLSNGLVVNGVTKQVISITFTFGGYALDRVPVDITDSNAFVQFYRFPNDGTVTGNTTLHWVKIEKGAKATDWSPAPEDVQGQIDATNNNLANNYSTTSAMNSAIQQKANEITSSVSETYATKQSVTDINNNLANNYSTTSQMNSAIQQKANEITSTVSQTYISNYEAKKLADTTTTGLNKYLFERYQRDGFNYGARPTLNDLVGARLIESQLVDNPPPHTSSLGDNYIGVLTFYLYYDYACTKTTTITTDDQGTVYLNNVGIYELTSCQPANVTFNMIKGLNRIDIIYAEGGGGDGVSWGGVDGWSAFGAYANVVTNEIANRTNELTLAMTQGNMLYTDPTFRSGNNGVEIYNNLGNGTVSRERIAAIEGCPNTSGYCIKITTNGEAAPGLGGFYFGNYCRYNAVFITKITAKIPIGYTIEWASNHYGDNGKQKWLSSKSGTGDWYDYYCKVKCGDHGNISNTNYFYLSGPQASAENPVTWYVSYATVFDVTDSDERITNLTNNLAVNYSTTSQMNSAIQQKANEITSSVSETYTTKSEFNSLQIGGTNLIQNGNFKGAIAGSTSMPNPWTLWGTEIHIFGSNGMPGYNHVGCVYIGCNLTDGRQSGIYSNRIHVSKVEKGANYMASFIFAIENNVKGAHAYIEYLNDTCDQIVNSQVIASARVSTNIGNGLNEHQYHIPFTMWTGDFSYVQITFNHGGTNTVSAGYLMIVGNVQIEKGNKATDWSPAPEDVQGQIDATNNNLANNYSTTSQMNSAIQQKANEITSSVSQTYTTKSETTAIQNQITTSRNLLMGSRDYNLDKWASDGAAIHDEWYNGTRIYTTTIAWANMNYWVSDLIDRGVIELFTPYTFSCYVMSTSSDYTPVIRFFGDGLPNFHNAVCGTASTTWQRISITLEWSSFDNRSYPIRFEACSDSPNSSVSYLKWACFQLERGKVATGWAPAPEDAQYGINDVYNNLTNNYSTTSAMNSAIQQKANEITSSVSQTYTTKTEFNNLEVGGTNLIYNGGFNRNLDNWHCNGGIANAQACNESPSGCMLCMEVTTQGQGSYQVLGFLDSTYCTDYVVSFYAKTNVDGSQMYVMMEGDPGTPSVFTLNGVWQKCVYKFRRNNTGFNALVFYANGNGARNIYIHSIKMEKGTVPSAWSPHPSEIENKVDNLSNNLANNYSTTSQMNSAIQQKANEITSSVSQTYITKSETSLINDTVAGNRKWLFEMYTNNQQVGTGGGTYPTIAHLANESLISSRLVDGLPGYTASISDYYIGVYTVYLYYESAYTWSGSIISDDESTTYLNGVAVCQAASCADTPFTMNFKKGINKLQIIHGEGGGGDGVTLSDLGPWKEYGAYPACVTAASSNHYASNSDIVQTANDLTIKFTESGGYNLLQNGHADKGSNYWVDNGGGITTHANAGGGATGNFFGTSFPHGISYYDWVKLLPNTHYVYQAKIWSNAAFSGNSATPLHFWFSYDTVNNTGDGYTILDYQQNVSYTGTWTQCYIHFVTGNNDIYIRPFIYTGGASINIFVTELMLSQSRVVQPWSPHPSEVYSGITQVDKDGIRVHHSNANSYTHMAPDGFFVNNNGTNVVQVTASGLYVQGNITSGSTIQGARITGSTFNSSNDVFQVLEDGTIETSFLAVNGAVSTDKLNVNDIENASYPKVLSEATTVYISPNGGVNAEEFYDGAYFTSLSNMLAVAPRNLNGYTLTIRMAGDLYENAALTWFHSGQVNFEMQGYTLYGYFYGYGASMCYRLYGNTNANNNGTWGHIKPNVGRSLGSYYYAVQFQYCQFAVNYIAVYPSSSSGSSSGGISAHRGATGIIFNAKACGDMRYLVRAEYAGRVHVNSTQGACNNATFCATTGAIITLNSSNNQAGRSTTGNPYWVGSGGIIAADQLLGMDRITFNNASQSGSSSSSGSATRKVTETVKATSADTYRSTVYNNWKGDGTVRQGDYGYGDCQGCWFFGNNLYNTMNAGTVTKVVIRIKRQSGGVNALQTLTVKSHNHTSRPSGAPTYTNTIGTCSCAVGSYIDLVITDQTTINKLKNCKGLGLSIGSASSPYAVCSGACSVIITYTTNN